MTTKENDFLRDFRRLLKRYDVTIKEYTTMSLTDVSFEDPDGDIVLSLDTIIEELTP